MKSVYAGGEKVAEFESYDELRVGENKPAFIYEGSELVYPNPVKDGLVLWYDFSGRTNNDAERGMAEDLSGNGNHGTLQNFNYTAESGYGKTGLLFDGVDDVILQDTLRSPNIATISATILYNENSNATQRDIIAWYTNVVLRVTKTGDVMFIDKRKSPDRFTSISSFDSTLPVNIDVVVTPEDNEIYINGVFSGSLSPSETGLMGINNTLRFGSFSTSSIYDGSLYSTKIYNRPLTAEEIAHNYAIEKERFGL